MRFHFKTISPEITAPLFVSPCDVPLTVRLAAKVLSGRKDLHEIAETQPLGIAFPTRHLASLDHRAS